MSHRRTRSLAALLLALVLMAAACGGDDSTTPDSGGGNGGATENPDADAGEPVPGGALVVGTSAEVDGYNPLANRWSGPAYQVGRAIYDPLVVMDSNNDWTPYLAESLEPNADFTVWTITLRPGITFHNGEPLDGEALAKHLNTAFVAPLTGNTFPDEAEAVATGELTTEVRLPEPWSTFPIALTAQAAYVLAPEMIDNPGANTFIGTGPFVFQEWVPDDHITVTRNDNYWQADEAGNALPYLDSIEFRPLGEPVTRVQTLETGGIDVAEFNNPELVIEIPTFADDPDYTVIDDVDITATQTLVLNLDSEPLDDPRIREAIARGVNSEAINVALFEGAFELRDNPFPNDHRWYTDTDYPTMDVEAATALVDEYVADGGDPSLRIMVSDVGNATVVAQLLQEQLQAIGLDAEIDALDQSAYIGQYISGDFDMVYLVGYFGDADPDAGSHFYVSENADPDLPVQLNFPHHRSDTIDEAIATNRATDDPAARKEAWETVHQTWAADLPYVYMLATNLAFVTTTEVHGLAEPVSPSGADLPAINRWVPYWTGVWMG